MEICEIVSSLQAFTCSLGISVEHFGKEGCLLIIYFLFVYYISCWANVCNVCIYSIFNSSQFSVVWSNMDKSNHLNQIVGFDQMWVQTVKLFHKLLRIIEAILVIMHTYKLSGETFLANIFVIGWILVHPQIIWTNPANGLLFILLQVKNNSAVFVFIDHHYMWPTLWKPSESHFFVMFQHKLILDIDIVKDPKLWNQKLSFDSCHLITLGLVEPVFSYGVKKCVFAELFFVCTVLCDCLFYNESMLLLYRLPTFWDKVPVRNNLPLLKMLHT